MPIVAHQKNNGTTSTRHNTKTFVDVFEKFGYEFSVNGSDQAVADGCPWCGREKFYLHIHKGVFHCKHCEKGGNASDLLTLIHNSFLERTTDDQLRLLLELRGGMCLQTVKRHEIALDGERNLWLIPFKNKDGKVVNMQDYSPRDGRKFNLPKLPTYLFNFHNLTQDKNKIVFLFEAPFDLIAFDYSLGRKRTKYDLIASPGTFRKEWVEFFRGRKVRAMFDNDEGGESHSENIRKLLGESGIASEVQVLKWPKGFEKGYDINDMVRDHPKISLVGWSSENSIKVTTKPKLIFRHCRDRKATERKVIEWPWPDHLRCGTYISFSGQQGSLKSTIAREIVARYTQSKKMPYCKTLGMPSGHVLYIHAEDDEDANIESLEVAGADMDKITLMPATLLDGDPMNVLEHLGEIEEAIQIYGIRLMIIDGQNSVLGSPNISTDMQSRNNVTNKLHYFAQRMNLCLICIRNEDPKGRAMGPQSMGDVGRCSFRTEELNAYKKERYFRLIFKKVTDTSPKKYPPIYYSVKDLGGAKRQIRWGINKGKVVKDDLDKKRGKKLC